ncbi:MAG: hypothetical protein ACRD4J_02200, partial [Nitrososphaeraceae archaeon]
MHELRIYRVSTLVWQSSYVLSVRIHQCRNYLLARLNLRSEDFHLRLRKERLEHLLCRFMVIQAHNLMINLPIIYFI